VKPFVMLVWKYESSVNMGIQIVICDTLDEILEKQKEIMKESLLSLTLEYKTTIIKLSDLDFIDLRKVPVGAK